MTEKFTDCVTGTFKKFYSDGRAREFLGNTFLCHVPTESYFYTFSVWAQAELALLEFRHKFAFLPPQSFHMTVFEGVCDQVREENNWIENVSLKTPLEEINSYFLNKIPSLFQPKGFEMQASDLVIKDSIRFILTPLNDQTAQDLQKFRDTVQKETKMKNQNADCYQFHCSFIYLLQELTQNEQKTLTILIKKIMNKLNSNKDFKTISFRFVEFCSFNDMSHFVPLAVLNKS